MPDYRIYLHDGPDTPPTTETFSAKDHAEALSLGELRLLLTSTFTHAVVSLDGQVVGSLKRDSQPGLDEVAADSAEANRLPAPPRSPALPECRR